MPGKNEHKEIRLPSAEITSHQKDDASPSFRTDIEGLRAIAIILVVGYHAGVPGFSGGYIGVDVFFVLSGYLITWLLVQEAEKTGTIDLVRFYSRRARRLLPALAVVLLATVLLGGLIYAPFEHRNLANTAIATAAYLSNLYFARAATDYLGAAAETNPLLHTWSLSVEEQFYLLWPLFVLFALGAINRRRRELSRRRLLWWMVIVAATSFVLSVYLTGIRQPWAFFLSPPRAWEFAIGAIAVLMPQGFWNFISPRGLKRLWSCGSKPDFPIKGASFLGWFGLCGILAAAFLFDKKTTFPGTAALIPALSTVFVLRAGSTRMEAGLAQLLSIRPLQEIGRLSYSWYLWHWPILVFATVLDHGISLLARLCLLMVSLVVAEASYKFIENPIRHNRRLALRPAFSLGMAAFITFFGVSMSFAWRQISEQWAVLPEQARFSRAKVDRPVYPSSDCHADYYRVDVNINDCITGPESASRTLVLFGDSHASQWYPALKQMAYDKGWQFILMTKSACAPVDAPIFDSRIGREYSECAIWRKNAIEKIREISPDLVVMASFSRHQLSDSEWASGTDSVLRSVSKASRNVAILRDTPAPGFDAPTWLARKQWTPDLISRFFLLPKAKEVKSNNVYDIQKQVAGNYDNVFTVDMVPEICLNGPCDLERDGVIMYSDSHHLSATFIKSLAPALTARLEDGIRISYSNPTVTTSSY